MPPAIETERQVTASAIAGRRDAAGWIAFAALLAVTCGWILSLPLFPSQDGAAHVYYARVSRDLMLGHAGFERDFRIARPFPPYSLHAYLLMLFLQWTSSELAEKLLACVSVIVGGIGLAYLARQVGRSASAVCALAVPFLLHRWIFFGFYGYAIGIGLALMAMGMWIRSEGRTVGRCTLFLLLTALTLFAHPVPYLVIVGFCWAEAVSGWWNSQTVVATEGMIRPPTRTDLLTLLIGTAFFAYIQRYSQSGALWNYELLADLRDKLFRIIDVFRTVDVLPVRVPAYNWILGVVLMLAVIAGCRLALREGRNGEITRVQLVVAWAFLMLIALPFLPRTMNGSGFFAARFSIWPPLLWFAAAAGVKLNRRAEKLLTVAAIGVTAFALFMMNAHIRPVSRQLDLSQAPPFGLHGVHVFTRSNSRATADLTFNPYEWAAIRVVDREGAILVDSPWMDLQIMMLEETGPKVRFDAENGLKIVSGPQANIAMAFTRCGDVRGESMAEHLQKKHPQQWRMQKYGCFEVLAP